MVKDLDSVNSGRHRQDVGPRILGQAFLAENRVRAMPGAIKKTVVAGEA